MNLKHPIQAKSTERALRTILPDSFKMVNDKSSNGYKFFNLLFGVELDQADTFLKELFSNSYLGTMDLGVEGELYEVLLSGLDNQSYLNTTISGIPIKITNNGTPGGESQFFDGDPTRLIYIGSFDLPSGALVAGNIIGLNYFRTSPSGYGYIQINTDIDQEEYLNYSGSATRLYLNTTGTILSFSGFWPGVFEQSFDEIGTDEVLSPLGSGYLLKYYPLTREIIDDSGVIRTIDSYEPYHGWVRDPYWGVVANVDYDSEYFYDDEGRKTYFRVALNNPYGSGNFNTEYLPLQQIPISGTLKIYDMDILDLSGNATEIPSTGKTLYYLKSDKFLIGETGAFDPIYVGYDDTVPDTATFGNIAGSGANPLFTTSWSYQRVGGYMDDGTKTWVEGSGVITNLIKITNPRSRYLVEYKYKVFDKAKYITSLDASRYLSFDTPNPIYSTSSTGLFEELSYEFTRDPNHSSEKARYITFDGWTIRPKSRITAVDFNLPILVETGDPTLTSFQMRKNYIGYSQEFVPVIPSFRNYSLNCPFDNVVALGTVTEDDLSGSGNTLEWFNDNSNRLWRVSLDGAYGKTSKYIGGSGYFYIDDVNLLQDNTFFQFDFRIPTRSVVTLMDLHQELNDRSIKIEIRENGQLFIISNGSEIQCGYRFKFDFEMKSLIIRVTPDREFTTNLTYSVYKKDSEFFEKVRTYVKTTESSEIADTYIHVLQNSTADIKNFKIWYEASTWQV